MNKTLLLTCFAALLLLLSHTKLDAQFAKDLQILSWSAPRSKGALTDSEIVKIAVKNIGAEAVSGFTIGFSQDGGETFKEEVVSQTLNAGSIMLYTFSENFAVLGTDGATYYITGRITLEGDEDLSNNEHTEEVINYLIGDVEDEPFEITTFPYAASGEYVMYTNNYGPGYNISNYMQAEDIVFAFTTTETQMYVDAAVTADYAGSFAPRPGIALTREKPSAFDKTDPDTEAGVGTGDWVASFDNAYCYYAQTYYLVIDKWTDYSCTYDLVVNLYRQHDFKYFNFESLSVNGAIDYENRMVTLTVPQGTDVTSLVPTFELPAYTEVFIDGAAQTSGSSVVDFTSDVTYTINQTITPNATQTWTVSVIEDQTTDIQTNSIDKITVSPNPANDVITVLSNDLNEINKVSIYSASGSLVLSQENLNTGQAIAIDQLVPGIYIVQIEANGNQVTTRFIKK